jgi:CBS domain-containing protein
MTVAAILKEKGRDVVTADPGASLADICARLAEKGIGAIILTDKSGKVEGIVSERDVVRAIARDGAAALAKPVSGAMTREVVSCAEEDTNALLMARMTQSKFRHMPVVKEGKLVGIVSIGDVVKRRIAEAEFEAKAMRDYIATG